MIDNYKILTLTCSDARLDHLSHCLISSDNESGESERLRILKDELGVEELYYLNTCNRVLFLFYSIQPISDIHHSLVKFLQNQSPDSEIRCELKEYSGEETVRDRKS